MATQQWKYHVFISFRGEDTRLNFVCHLDKALRRTGLNTFVDNQLRRGEEINTALLQAIQDSKVALIIFSENYASSSWCLDELLKIIECYETHDQIVIPVFYRVNPSDVRKQNRSFGKSFAKHIENPRYSNKIQKWKDALTKAANISGRDSNAIREDNALIDLIVRDILEKLKHVSPRSLEGFVGLKSKISEVKTLLVTGSSDVRMLGIWGMGGIGKTTLAEAICDEVSSQFEGHCIVKKVREAWEKGREQRLLEQLISELLEQSDVKIDTTIIGPEPFLVERLKSKRVFVVFDDVTDRSQLEYLIGNQGWFGVGSNIIITSRDKQVFKGINGINIYEVEALSYTESHQLFVWNALRQKRPSQDHIPLIDSFVNYARGNPLAIKVLGSCVCENGVELWKEALTKLPNCPNEKIYDVLKLSYDGLDREEKAIFLDIACFFKGENVNEAKRVFRSCGFSANIGVSRLVGKSLVTISERDKLDMHDLLQDMGREIVRQESNDPRRRSRLWDAEEIRRVFEKNEGTEASEIQSISLNTSQIRDDILLDPNVFKRMPNLKVLRFYTRGERSKLHLTERLRFLPNGLRYLHWDGYSFESLPTGFHAKELHVLDLPNSNIKQILKEAKGAGKLKAAAQSLIKSPLISCFINIASRILPSGIGNIKVPSSSCQFFSKITSLDMSYCQNLKSLPNNVDFQCLQLLNLTGCSNIKIFPEISSNLRKLYVGGTSIKEVHPSSLERLSRLEELNMKFCEKLESLPSNICKLQSLQKLDLRYCSSLKKFPEILEPMSKLRRVELSDSGIEAIPSSIDNMKGLESLGLENCNILACFPESSGNLMRRMEGTACKKRKRSHGLLDIEDLQSLFFSLSPYPGSDPNFDIDVIIHTGEDMYVEMPSHLSECVSYLIDLPFHPCLRFFSPWYILDLSSCSIRELPKDLGSLSYLRELYLESNNFEEIPASIKQLSLLESLRLDDCPKLRSLPQLPTSLCELTVVHCESLKTLLAFKQPFFNGRKIIFNFRDCLKLEEKECEAMAYKMLRNGPKDVYLYYPGSRSPEWFRYRTTGDIVRIKLPSNWFFNRRFFGFAFCVVFDPHIFISHKFSVEFECYFEDNCNPTILFKYQSDFYPCVTYIAMPPKQQVGVWCVRDFNVWISERRQLFLRHRINMASFKFFWKYGESYCKIKNCGITPLYMQVDEGCSGRAPLYMQVDEGCSGRAPLYMQVDKGAPLYMQVDQGCSRRAPLYMQVDEGHRGRAPLYMQVHEGYVQGDDDDNQDDADENAYWMLESLLPRKLSTKKKMKLKKKDKDHDENMNSEDTEDDMIPEDDENELFETADELFEIADELFEIQNGLSEVNDELFETALSLYGEPYP